MTTIQLSCSAPLFSALRVAAPTRADDRRDGDSSFSGQYLHALAGAVH